MFLWHDVIAVPSPGGLKEGAHPGLLEKPWARGKLALLRMAPGPPVGGSVRLHGLEKAKPSWPLLVLGKQAESMLVRRPRWTHGYERGRRGGKAAETSHSQHANTNHFFVKSFSNGESRDLCHRPSPGVVHLPHYHLNRRTNSRTQMENKTTWEKNVLRNTWKLLTASVKYMKFW